MVLRWWRHVSIVFVVFGRKELSIATRGRACYQQKAGSLLLPCNTMNIHNFEPNMILNIRLLIKINPCKPHSDKASQLVNASSFNNLSAGDGSHKTSHIPYC